MTRTIDEYVRLNDDETRRYFAGEVTPLEIFNEAKARIAAERRYLGLDQPPKPKPKPKLKKPKKQRAKRPTTPKRTAPTPEHTAVNPTGRQTPIYRDDDYDSTYLEAAIEQWERG